MTEEKKIVHKHTGLELFFDRHPRAFALVERGRRFLNNEAEKVLQTLEEENVDVNNFEIQCAEL